MTEHPPKNLAASIHQRLLNASKTTGRTFNDLVVYYAIERFLYRLSMSNFASRVVLKGGLLLQVWNTPATRITRDIDLLGRVSNDLVQIRDLVRAVCAVAVDDDALRFDLDSVATGSIAEDADYEGVRTTFRCHFGKMPIAMQIDFGFSDVITPGPENIIYPTVLDHPPARLLAYNRETVVAEKFEAMVKHGELNSRMKDFFDVWVLSESFPFSGAELTDAVRSTFTRRGTTLSEEPACFSARFSESPTKVAQWRAFLRTARVTNAPLAFTDVVSRVRAFLEPVTDAIERGGPHDQRWSPGGSWTADGPS